LIDIRHEAQAIDIEFMSYIWKWDILHYIYQGR
jgi:hypothetical protein